MSYHVALEDKPSNTDINTIIQGLTAFNQSKSNGDTPHYLVGTVRDEHGAIAGGVVAAVYLGWLQVSALWLADELRGNGYGSQLLALVEDAAARKGCKNAFLETLSFQALPFYQKRGYSIFSRLADFPPGGARFALTKALASPAIESDAA